MRPINQYKCVRLRFTDLNTSSYLEAHDPQIVLTYNYSTGDYQSLYWHSCANRVRYLLATHEAVVISSCSKTLNKYIKLIQPHRWSPRP